MDMSMRAPFAKERRHILAAFSGQPAGTALNLVATPLAPSGILDQFRVAIALGWLEADGLVDIEADDKTIWVRLTASGRALAAAQA